MIHLTQKPNNRAGSGKLGEVAGIGRDARRPSWPTKIGKPTGLWWPLEDWGKTFILFDREGRLVIPHLKRTDEPADTEDKGSALAADTGTQSD